MWGDPDSLRLFIHDFSSGREIKRYTTAKEDNLIFGNTSPDMAHTISTRKNDNFMKYEDYKSVEDFLLKSSKGIALIYATENSAGLNEIIIGTVRKTSNLVPGISVQTSSGTATTIGPTFTIEKWKRVNKFNLLVDPNTHQLHPGDIVFKIFE